MSIEKLKAAIKLMSDGTELSIFANVRNALSDNNTELLKGLVFGDVYTDVADYYPLSLKAMPTLLKSVEFVERVSKLQTASESKMTQAEAFSALNDLIESARELKQILDAAEKPSVDSNVEVAPVASASGPVVYVEAYACADNADGPRYAKFVATPAFCDQLKRLQAICVKQGLSEVSIGDAPDAWGPGNITTELCLYNPELVVTQLTFQFQDIPKHSDYSIASRDHDIEAFIDAVSRAGSEPLFYGDIADQLREMVEEEAAESLVNTQEKITS